MSPKINVRKANPDDAEGIIGAHISSIREVCSKDYTHEQIEAWAGRKFKAELWRQTIERDYVWVAEVESRIVGFSQLAIMDQDNAEVMGLYLMPLALGHSLGKKLLAEMLSVCRNEKINRVSLYATLTAADFYQRQGFLKQPPTTIEIQGVAIPCIPMTMIISDAA